MFRQITLGSLVLALAGAPAAWADHRGDGSVYDYAKVVNVEPIVRVVRVRTPVEECWDEVQTYPAEYRTDRSSTVGATLLGGIIGGVIGHQIGSGRGNDAATVAGAVIGSAIGHDAAKRRERGYYEPAYSRTVQRCSVNHELREEQRIDGYLVTYKYHGRTYQTRMPHDPGDKVRVRVAVTPDPY